jgi:hypothetical protein
VPSDPQVVNSAPSLCASPFFKEPLQTSGIFLHLRSQSQPYTHTYAQKSSQIQTIQTHVRIIAVGIAKYYDEYRVRHDEFSENYIEPSRRYFCASYWIFAEIMNPCGKKETSKPLEKQANPFRLFFRLYMTPRKSRATEGIDAVGTLYPLRWRPVLASDRFWAPHRTLHGCELSSQRSGELATCSQPPAERPQRVFFM